VIVHDDASIRHVLRRAGFGASPAELALFRDLRSTEAMDLLINYEQVPDDVDEKIGQTGYVGVMVRGTFAPNTNITDARQRWLFRMVHTGRPLQEKMTLFWHNHFATAYSKLAGAYGSSSATRLMASKASEDPKKQEGQIEVIRRMCLGNFKDLVVAMAQDPGMLVWLDGRFNTKQKPQENFGRELMELFSMGVRYYSESDVYAAARVFTGWNLRRTTDNRDDLYPKYEFAYNAGSHDTAAKTFTFAVYPDGSRTIPARSADGGLQDGIDLITAVASHPETAKRLVRRLWNFFVSETAEPPAEYVQDLAGAYLQNDLALRVLMRRMLRSHEFSDPSNYYSRYSWPVESVVRSIKEVGWAGYSLNDAVNHLVNMGQQLFEPPDVAGWELGPGWISSGAMLSRMNFASALVTSQRTALLNAAKPHAQTPESFLSYFVERLAPSPLDNATYDDLRAYLRGSGTWTGSDTQVRNKAAGLTHLILGSGEYVFV
jgi:uncharacterized protein (DUF1800 family)